jgi:hypothetical protein
MVCFKKREVSTLFQFPKEQEKQKIWASNMKLDYKDIGRPSRICSMHFEDTHLSRTALTRKRLLASAVPTLHPKKISLNFHKKKIPSDYKAKDKDKVKIYN